MTRRSVGLWGVVASCAFLAGCGAPPSCALCDAIEARDPAAVRTALAAGAAVTAREVELAADPNRVVTRASGSPDARDREIVEALIDTADANVSWKVLGGGLRGSSSRGSQRTRYLAEALMELWGDRPLLDRLMARGLDVRGTAGGQALRQAVASGRTDAVRALVAAGAPVNHVGINLLEQTTPLAEAIQLRDLDLIALLEAAGAVEWPE